MDSPSKMGLDVYVFIYKNYQHIEKYKKTQLASGVMAGSIAILALMWIALQSMGMCGYTHVIGGYKLPAYFQNHFSGLKGIADNVVVDTGSLKFPRLPRINENVLNSSVHYGVTVINRMRRLEKNLVGAEIRLAENTPSHKQYIFSTPNENALQMQADALVAAKASTYLVQHHCQRYGLSEEICAHFVSTLKLDGTILGDICALRQMVDCTGNSSYRSIDGSCNNPENPKWGSALTAYSRVLFPRYSDGIQEPRKADRRRKHLPSPRIISTTLSSPNELSDSSKTLSVMQWSQFIAHDLAHTPVRKMVTTGEPISCCNPDGSWPSPRYIHPDCAAIQIPEQDPVYGNHYVNCMGYVRSLPVIRQDCNFGPVEQMNQVSHFLDGSTVYSSTLKRARELRSFKDGKFLVENHENHSYLPSADSESSTHCHEHETCYKAGDDRANFEPSLAVMHTIWHREHNRIAEKLHQINPLWSDEILYQESRRIVIAEIQHITYNEWLPIVLGKNYTKAIGLEIKEGHSHDYSSYEDPGVSNEAATAVFRSINSLRQGDLRGDKNSYEQKSIDETSLTTACSVDRTIAPQHPKEYNEKLLDHTRRLNTSLRLSDYFYKPRVIESEDIFDGLIRGLATQTSSKMDINLVADITHRLYKTNSTLGLDAISLDVQQGRDHGLPGYNHYREYCGLPGAKKFEDFLDYIPSETVGKLEKLYDQPNDVDLLIGGLAERSVEDSLFGPTFRCLLSEQMARSRWTDRFFYDSANQPHPFTSEQLKQLRRVTLARIFCDNGNHISRMQPNVFIRPQAGNEIVRCDDFQKIPSVDLYAWAEKAKAYR